MKSLSEETMKPLPGQQSLFDAPRTARQEYDIPLNSTVSKADMPRLNAQHHAILDRLREGPVTNTELSQICQRFGARLQEIKLAGFSIGKECIKPGVWVYRLLSRIEG
jgi:hypothetical protein